MKKRPKIMIGVGLGLVLMLGAIGASRSKSGEVTYTVEEAKTQDLRESVTANGEIQAKTRVSVGTSVTGEIMKIHVKDGQWVKAGDLLVTLDQERFLQGKSQAELSFKTSRQDLQNADATFQKQSLTFQRQDALFKQGLLSAEDHQTQRLALATAQTALERARVGVAQAQATVALAEDSLSKTVLRAPMGGRVTGLQAEKGETAIAGQTNVAGAVLMVISDMSEMLAEMKVGELDVVKLNEGAPAEVQVDALPGKTFTGRVMSVATASDRGRGGAGAFNGGPQESQNYKVRVLIEGTPDQLQTLRPGMSCRVGALAMDAKGVLTVPLAAVQERDIKRKEGDGLLSTTRTVVFVAKEGKAEERALKTGLVTRSSVQVLDGVKAGEKVITGPIKGLLSLTHGASIRLQPSDKKP